MTDPYDPVNIIFSIFVLFILLSLGVSLLVILIPIIIVLWLLYPFEGYGSVTQACETQCGACKACMKESLKDNATNKIASYISTM